MLGSQQIKKMSPQLRYKNNNNNNNDVFYNDVGISHDHLYVIPSLTRVWESVDGSKVESTSFHSEVELVYFESNASEQEYCRLSSDI